jgi:hypothetical protein
VKQLDGGARDGFLRSKQRRLGVQSGASPREKGRGDAEDVAVAAAANEGGTGHVPGRVAASLERGADSARWERRTVGLALDELLAIERGDELLAFKVIVEEGVVCRQERRALG